MSDSEPETDAERIRFLIDHKQNVIKYGLILVQWLIEQDKVFEAKQLYRNILTHDDSKFKSPEWEELTIWRVDKTESFKKAKAHHQALNPHHPEYFDRRHTEMPDVYLAEMAADWYSRMKENKEPNLNGWLAYAKEHYKFSEEIWNKILKYVKIIEEKDDRSSSSNEQGIKR